MRLADGPQVECEIGISAAQEHVWGLASDIATSARHSPELQEVEWLDGASGPAVGACFAGRNRNAGLGEWRTRSRITRIEEHRTFQWEVVHDDDRCDHGPLAVWTFTLQPLPDENGTCLRHGMRLGDTPGPLQQAVARYPDREEQIIDGRLAMLRDGIEATLAGVKADAEGQGRRGR
ncbi:SRPBCC family protein [Streptomyces sp. NBC_00859]|uniref:SRPBCC family protein n=1 Tax=Streptomyces sp. NBC_00859 TaxID=2903682 RepID=UPI0038682669|nr:SRPBCC family protein [Streptomyces sp. NBC_00859]